MLYGNRSERISRDRAAVKIHERGISGNSDESGREARAMPPPSPSNVHSHKFAGGRGGGGPFRVAERQTRTRDETAHGIIIK